MRILLIILAISALSSCARFNQWQLNTTHEWTYSDTRDVIWDAIPVKGSDWTSHGCELIFNAPIPPTVKFKNRDDMAAAINSYRQGMYEQRRTRNPNTKKPKFIGPGQVPSGIYLEATHEVYYLNSIAFSEGSTLVHEYAHYMWDISNLEENKYCQKQAFAYLVQYGWDKALAAERWQKAYKKERSKNIGRR